MSALWTACLQHLEKTVSAQEFNTWVRPLQVHEELGTLLLLAPNRFVLDRVKAHFLEHIENSLNKLNNGDKTQVLLQVGSRKKILDKTLSNTKKVASGRGGKGKNAKVLPLRSSAKTSGFFNHSPSNHGRAHIVNSPLNAKFTFNNFITGQCNQLAHAAALQAAENCDFNPLFIYGGVGLGKTHLMQAVGHALGQLQPNSRVVYLHSERFVSEMVKAIQNKVIDDFKDYYRSVDVLLLDDIQFLAGKVRSQEEFFHTFNTLIEGHQQVVITSDRVPGAINGLEERLKSRLGSGLTVSVDPPPLNTRMDILRNKAAQSAVRLPDDVAWFIADNIESNVRELEGALHRLLASARFLHQDITLDFSQQALKDLIVTQLRVCTINDIQQVVAEYYKISVEEMMSKRRHRYIVRPRQMAISLAKELTQQSLASIGNAFGGRDRTTIMHSCKTINSLKTKDQELRQDYQNLSKVLQH